MPRDIRHLVRSRYYNIEIKYVIEILAADKTAYLVNIEAKHFIKVILVLAYEVSEMGSISKTK